MIAAVTARYGGRPVTVVGLGIEGRATARFLAHHQARVTISDVKRAEELGAAIASLGDLPIRFSLGGNRVEDVEGADVVFVSQGVPLDIPMLQEARRQNIPLSSMTKLFMDLCPAPMVGITGSAGKSTTTALVGEMLRAAGQPTFVGGNIGTTLLDDLERITPHSWAVLEVSHTQLELTNRSPHVAAVLNISPSHADRYPDFEQYRELKRRLLLFQTPADVAVLNYDDPATRAMASTCAGRVTFFSRQSTPPAPSVYREGETVVYKAPGEGGRVVDIGRRSLKGEHNVENVLAACAVAFACGVPAEVCGQAVAGFTGLPHRLEAVAVRGGAAFYNDSIATTPARTLAGLRCFDEPLVLIAGGREKHLPLEELAAEANRRCHAVVCYGEAGATFVAAFEQAQRSERARLQQVAQCADFATAVETAARLAFPGCVVLLSPAATSFDQFANFEERGEVFRSLVLALANKESP